LSFEPVADTYTDPQAPGANHGTDSDLRAGGDGAGGLGRIIFLRFDVKGAGSVKSAKLYLKAMNAGGGGDIRAVSDDTWSEGAVTHQSKPSHDATVLGSLAKVEIDGVYFFDVTAAVKGDGLHSFAITSTDGDGCGYNSRENSGTHPELVIESAGGGGAGGSGGSVGGAAGTGSGGASAGGTSAGGGSGGGPSASGGTTEADDGCGCRTPGGRASGAGLLLLAGALGALAWRRRAD
jgi:MYXO-CTERM domain-containing protein